MQRALLVSLETEAEEEMTEGVPEDVVFRPWGGGHICINSLCLFVCLSVQAVTSLFTGRFSKVWYRWNQGDL